MGKPTQPEPGQARFAQLEALGHLDAAYEIRASANWRRLTAADYDDMLKHARAIVAALEPKESK